MHRHTLINSMKLLLMILLVTFIVVAAVNPPLLACKINTTLEVTHNENNRNNEINSFKELYAPLQLEAWDQQNCQGNTAWTKFDNHVLAQNLSNAQVSHSFKLNRTLEGKEQLEISVTNRFNSWYPDKDQLSANSSSCTNFWQSYLLPMAAQHITMHRLTHVTDYGITQAFHRDSKGTILLH